AEGVDHVAGPHRRRVGAVDADDAVDVALGHAGVEDGGTSGAGDERPRPHAAVPGELGPTHAHDHRAAHVEAHATPPRAAPAGTNCHTGWSPSSRQPSVTGIPAATSAGATPTSRPSRRTPSAASRATSAVTTGPSPGGTRGSDQDTT